MLPGVGVFGTSLTARVIIPLLKNEGFAVKALWGRTQEEAEELAKEMNVPFYTNRIDDVLLHQDVDLVCINLPPPLTRQIAVKTLGEFRCWGGREGGKGRMLRPCRGGLLRGSTTFTLYCGAGVQTESCVVGMKSDSCQELEAPAGFTPVRLAAEL